MGLLEVVGKHYPYDEDMEGRITDKDGNTPFHLVMERKRSPISIKVCEILSKCCINPKIVNIHGKRAGDGKKGKDHRDRRFQILQEAAQKFEKKSEKRKRKKTKSIPSSTPFTDNSITVQVVPSKEKSLMQSQDSPQDPDDINIQESIKEMLKELSSKPQTYFEPPPDYKRQDSGVAHSTQSSAKNPPQKDTMAPYADLSTTEAALDPIQQIFTINEDVDVDHIAKNLEGCSWEVECTEKVKKFFVNPKVSLSERKAAVKKIKTIADGIPLNNQDLCKKVRSDSKLYETKFTKGARIIWEVAVQFSPRLTRSEADNSTHQREYIYSEVIRLWDVVRDHDNLNRSIDNVVECIKKSQRRGEKAAIRTPLVMQKQKKQCTAGQEQLRHPQYYICNASDTSAHEFNEVQIQFLPAGSTRDDEYNVITFYSFDSSFVKSMLDGDDVRRDFPFKEWPKEHDIINMRQGKVSILLLGRSGTGKTTCCLYRLWNQFQNYWLHALVIGPLIEKRPLAILNKEELQTTESDSSYESLESDDDTDDSEDSIQEIPTQNCEHFHQVFITKNYVLCAQMKKRFYDLAASNDIANNHMKYEEADIPNSFSAVDDYAYPLFLTARQFFLILDNSLEDSRNFFPRDDDGKLKERILSSDYDHEDPDTLLDLEESDTEDERENDSDFDDESSAQQPVTVKKKLSERREVTSSYFTEKIWPKISKNLQTAKIDPLLVWMEIKSFIKGSMDAVEKKEGYLSLEEYESLGKKMAPNYVDKRRDIYQIFNLYVNYIRHQCEDKVFDECDLNHSIYTRLNSMKDLPWSIHSIYIDEVQDFTQAELSILTRICRDPNNLFLTGDTAQSIMRGIAFRFSDLRNIFHRASKQSIKSKPVKVPMVNELTVNFRSHTGILKLAASVIDLMKEFFPSSFDRLPGDEGMFPGPTPIVLDSCNVSDLALVLQTNKREASTIEFGAHQVIIVQSEEAKKNIPDVLKAGIILTVFESKGLEFDDVLLYNFFKYSKVS